MAEKKQKSKLTPLLQKLRSGKQRITPLLPEFLIIVGILSVLYSTSHRYLRNRALQVNETVVEQYTEKPEDQLSQPVHIDIPWFVDVPVQEEVYANGNWTISENTASYLSQSARPGEDGNIIIYGHNKREILGNIRALEGNEVITITTEDGTEHQYKVTKIAEVNPNQIEFLQPTETETLTIYTCSGFMDNKRFIVRAEPTEN